MLKKYQLHSRKIIPSQHLFSQIKPKSSLLSMLKLNASLEALKSFSYRFIGASRKKQQQTIYTLRSKGTIAVTGRAHYNVKLHFFIFWKICCLCKIENPEYKQLIYKICTTAVWLTHCTYCDA